MAGNSPINLNSVVCQAGDRLVIEVGYAKNCTSLGRYATFRYGDSAGSDLPEDFTTTSDLDPWVHFSNKIKSLVSPVTIEISRSPDSNEMSLDINSLIDYVIVGIRTGRLRVAKHNDNKITTFKGLK